MDTPVLFSGLYTHQDAVQSLPGNGTCGSECWSSAAAVFWFLSSSSSAGPSALATIMKFVREGVKHVMLGRWFLYVFITSRMVDDVPACSGQFCKWCVQCLASLNSIVAALARSRWKITLGMSSGYTRAIFRIVHS